MTEEEAEVIELRSELLIHLRRQAGLTVVQAAKLVYVSPRAWQRWESGDRSIPLAALELFSIKVGDHYDADDLAELSGPGKRLENRMHRKLTSAWVIEQAKKHCRDSGFDEMDVVVWSYHEIGRPTDAKRRHERLDDIHRLLNQMCLDRLLTTDEYGWYRIRSSESGPRWGISIVCQSCGKKETVEKIGDVPNRWQHWKNGEEWMCLCPDC